MLASFLVVGAGGMSSTHSFSTNLGALLGNTRSGGLDSVYASEQEPGASVRHNPVKRMKMKPR